MERQYQRGAIQDDSLKYERLKHSGELPLIGVNTFLARSPDDTSNESSTQLTRATPEEKELCISRLQSFHAAHTADAPAALSKLKRAALAEQNVFAELMNAVQSCSLGQITHALYDVGGEYRRNL
jgi:methylmalonyl-CoA mutase